MNRQNQDKCQAKVKETTIGRGKQIGLIAKTFFKLLLSFHSEVCCCCLFGCCFLGVYTGGAVRQNNTLRTLAHGAFCLVPRCYISFPSRDRFSFSHSFLLLPSTCTCLPSVIDVKPLVRTVLLSGIDIVLLANAHSSEHCQFIIVFEH